MKSLLLFTSLYSFAILFKTEELKSGVPLTYLKFGINSEDVAAGVGCLESFPPVLLAGFLPAPFVFTDEFASSPPQQPPPPLYFSTT